MRNLVWLIFIILLVACKKPAGRNNEITKIELERSGAWADFGASISVDTSFSYKYFGDYGNVKQGYFIGSVDRKFWDTLNSRFERSHFKTVPLAINISVKDAEYFELIIYWKRGKRRILRVDYGQPDLMFNTIKWLDTSYKAIKLHQVKGPIKFETTYHNLPKPAIDHVNFPPPIKRRTNNSGQTH